MTAGFTAILLLLFVLDSGDLKLPQTLFFIAVKVSDIADLANLQLAPSHLALFTQDKIS
jgi:hypothetical protein